MKHLLIAAVLLVNGTSVVTHAVAQAADMNAKSSETTQPKDATQHSAANVAVEPASTGEPHTEMLDTANAGVEHDPLLEPKPLPPAELSLVGGLARKVDLVHNRVTIEPFGGGQKYVVYFDERTRILSGGRETTALAIHPGDRIYVDTQALGAQVFARTIQVRSKVAPAKAMGQIIEVLGGQVRLQDRLSGTAIRFMISDQTKVEERGKTAAASDLHTGTLVEVTFTPSGRRGEAQSIAILASPGESYAFAGVLTDVDVRDGVLALDNDVDGNNYELYFDPLSEKNVARLTVGTPVYITGSFDGKRYHATSIKVNENAVSQP